MRVIAGSAKGAKLLAVKGSQTRPILDRVKGALFNIISDLIVGSTALDLFAGTGALGIETLSRGAASCIFVDNSKMAVQIIKKNIEKAGFVDISKVIKASVFTIDSYLQENKMRFGIILVGAPYSIVEQEPTRKRLFLLFRRFVENQILLPEGIIVLQHRRGDVDISRETYMVEIYDSRIYGNTQLSFLRPCL